jgi:hypothetical protein
VKRAFTHRGARSLPFAATLGFLVVVESVGVHVLLFRRSPILAIALSLLGVAGLVWLIRDQRALGAVPTTISAGGVHLRVGLRAEARIPRAAIASAVAPAWSDLPAAPEPGYLHPTKPAEPNVLLTFTEPVTVRLVGGLRRPVRRLALFVDEPAAFLGALNEPA